MTEKERWTHASSIKYRAVGYLSDSSNDAGDLSLSCSVSSVESKESEVSEGEGELETVEPYQFDPVPSDSSVESDTEAKMTILGTEKNSAAETVKILHAWLLKMIVAYSKKYTTTLLL